VTPDRISATKLACMGYYRYSIFHKKYSKLFKLQNSFIYSLGYSMYQLLPEENFFLIKSA